MTPNQELKTIRVTKEDGPGPGKADGRTALLNAACHYIATKGLRGLRVEEVAAEAGVATSLIYHHFGDRAALLRAALEHVGQRADVYTRTDPDENGRSALIASALAEVQDIDQIRENSAAWNEFRDAAVFDETLRPVLFRYTQEWINDVADLVRTGKEDGSIPEHIDAESVGHRITALTEGLSTRWLSGFINTEAARHELHEAIELSLDGE